MSFKVLAINVKCEKSMGIKILDQEFNINPSGNKKVTHT